MRRIGFTASTRLLVTRVHGRSHVTPLPWYALWHVGRAAAPRNTRGDGGLGWLGPQRPRSLCAAAAAAAAAGAGAGAEPDSSCTKFVEYKNEVDRDAFEELVLGSGRMTDVAHKMWEVLVKPGDVVVDATCGNGHDTLKLATLALEASSTTGRVVSFDIQQVALDATRRKLQQAGLQPAQMACVQLEAKCHSRIGECVEPRSARLVAFNLGYLPGGDRDIRTEAETTLAAFKAAARATMVNGVVFITAYIGHEGGSREYEALLEYLRTLDPREWNVVVHDVVNRARSPILICCHRRRGMSITSKSDR